MTRDAPELQAFGEFEDRRAVEQRGESLLRGEELTPAAVSIGGPGRGDACDR